HATPNVARFSTGFSSQYMPTFMIANRLATSGIAHRGWILIFGFLRAARKKTAMNPTSRMPSFTRSHVMGWRMAPKCPMCQGCRGDRGAPVILVDNPLHLSRLLYLEDYI